MTKVTSDREIEGRGVPWWITVVSVLLFSACTSVQDSEVEFIVDSDCRNGGHVQVGDLRYGLSDLAPSEWQGVQSIRGEIVGNERSATFTSVESDDVPSFSLRVTTEPTIIPCITWDETDNQTELAAGIPEEEIVTSVPSPEPPAQETTPASGGQPPLEVESPVTGIGVPCAQQPNPDIGPDESVDHDRRGEALVFHLTGIDELAITEENEGDDITYGNPNYGGVYGDLNGGWVVAVVDCSLIDADEIAALAGGADSLTLIQVPFSFAQLNGFSDRLSQELAALDVPFNVRIDSTLTGRHIVVTVEDVHALPDNFGRELPEDAFTIQEGEVPSPG